MAAEEQETEVKFYIRDIKAINARLLSLGAKLVHPRMHELNLRFDTPGGGFAREGRVLRLRQDEAIRLTYKDGTQLKDGALSRREIEFSVDNFDSARQFLEALGYEIVFIYEKYRTTYDLHGLSSKEVRDFKHFESQIMLDELPYGNFLEIEGKFNELKPIARLLDLNWDAAIPASYHSLFERASNSRNLAFRDLSFEKFKNIKLDPGDLEVEPADS
jgi:adenylate cyclase, class 2